MYHRGTTTVSAFIEYCRAQRMLTCPSPLDVSVQESVMLTENSGDYVVEAHYYVYNLWCI